MRTTMLLALLLTAVGCVAEAPETSEASSNLTYTSSYTFYSPRLAIVARIANQRQTADDLRALAAATKPPLYPTWTVLQEYRNVMQFMYDSADSWDVSADSLESTMATANDMDALAELSEEEQLRMQMSMDRQAKLISTLDNLMVKAKGTACAIIDNMK